MFQYLKNKTVEIDTVGGYVDMPLWEYLALIAFAPVCVLIMGSITKFLFMKP